MGPHRTPAVKACAEQVEVKLRLEGPEAHAKLAQALQVRASLVALPTGCCQGRWGQRSPRRCSAFLPWRGPAPAGCVACCVGNAALHISGPAFPYEVDEKLERLAQLLLPLPPLPRLPPAPAALLPHHP